MKWHPLDDPGFRDWIKDYEPLDFAYGIYDAKWAELYEQYEDETTGQE